MPLPLGGVIQATGLDAMEDAMDNEGNIQIVFEILEDTPLTEPLEVEFSSEPPKEPPPSGEQP